MDKRIKDIFTMTDDREKSLWQDALFVFDTSVIGDMYFLTKSSLDTLVAILDYFKDRCWIPAQVMYEYYKNREKFVKNPIGEKYGNPKFMSNGLVNEIKAYMDLLKVQPYYHPFLDAGMIDKLNKYNDSISKGFDDIKVIIRNQYEKRKKELLDVESDDTILDMIESMQVGTPFSHSELMDIAKDAAIRHEHCIPPGYEDVDKKDGIQKFGDLIVWKEVLNHAKLDNKPVVFICNDVKKGDMYLLGKDDVVLGPRHELIREFIDTTGQDFWMYTLSDFISKLEEQYKDPSILPLFSGLDSVKYALDLRALERKGKGGMIVCCDNCKKTVRFEDSEFYYDWEACGLSEWEMGTETEWDSNEYCTCPECGKEIEFTFRVWEYPVGIVNYTEIECDGAKVIRPLSLGDKIEVYDHEVCIRCGRPAILNKDGLCDECENEFLRNLEDD